MTDPRTLPELPDEDLIAILGRPNFMCGQLADVLRKNGRDIPRKAEAEQAHVILFLLRHWQADPAKWAENAGAEIGEMAK